MYYELTLSSLSLGLSVDTCHLQTLVRITLVFLAICSVSFLSIARTLSKPKCPVIVLRQLLLIQSKDQLTGPLSDSDDSEHWVRRESLRDGRIHHMQVIHALDFSV
jgi:hypothetical protein